MHRVSVLGILSAVQAERIETYDQYGQTCTYSEGFGSETACLKAAKADLARINGRDGYGKCQAIIWPPKVTILGKRIRG